MGGESAADGTSNGNGLEGNEGRGGVVVRTGTPIPTQSQVVEWWSGEAQPVADLLRPAPPLITLRAASSSLRITSGSVILRNSSRTLVPLSMGSKGSLRSLRAFVRNSARAEAGSS